MIVLIYRGASQSNAFYCVKIIEQIRHLKSHLFLKILLRTLYVRRIIIVRTRETKGKLWVSYSSITNAFFPSYYTSILISIYDKITLLWLIITWHNFVDTCVYDSYSLDTIRSTIRFIISNLVRLPFWVYIPSIVQYKILYIYQFHFERIEGLRYIVEIYCDNTDIWKENFLYDCYYFWNKTWHKLSLTYKKSLMYAET